MNFSGWSLPPAIESSHVDRPGSSAAELAIRRSPAERTNEYPFCIGIRIQTYPGKVCNACGSTAGNDAM